MSTKVEIKGVVVDAYQRTSKSGYVTNCVVVDDADPGSKYPNPIEIEAKEPVKVSRGDKVTVEFFVNGRSWTNQEGEVRYFTSLRLASIIVTETAGPTDWKGVLAFAAKFGEDEARVRERCAALKEKLKGRKFGPEDYRAIADEIAAEHGEGESADGEETADDDMPF